MEYKLGEQVFLDLALKIPLIQCLYVSCLPGFCYSNQLRELERGSAVNRPYAQPLRVDLDENGYVSILRLRRNARWFIP
jgi:hypothetical protein